jgi:hypothetical protein
MLCKRAGNSPSQLRGQDRTIRIRAGIVPKRIIPSNRTELNKTPSFDLQYTAEIACSAASVNQELARVGRVGVHTVRRKYSWV